MSVYVTGDCHGDFFKFNSKSFPQGKNLTKDDIIIVCGDFGLWWDNPQERFNLEWLDHKPWTTVFVDGNHENFDRLNSEEFPIVPFYGGIAHQIRPSIYHMMRGSVCKFEGKTFFMFGGASSHDIQDGLLHREDFESDSDFRQAYRQQLNRGKMIRAEHLDWWREELPTEIEKDWGWENLLYNHDKQVNFIISHTGPQNVLNTLLLTDKDPVSEYFDELVAEGIKFDKWYFGHIHLDRHIIDNYYAVYNDIIQIL